MASAPQSVYVMHSYPTLGGIPLRLNLDDHWFDLPTDEPVEIESPFYAQKLVELYGPVYGIIEVPTMRNRSGLHIDIDAAEALAKTARARSEDILLANWVRGQQEERVKMNLPPLPPTGRVEEIIRERQIDLKATYNLVPVGFDFKPSDAARDALERENAQLRSQLSTQSDTSTRLEAMMAKLANAAGLEMKDLEPDSPKAQAPGKQK